jgi:hypothetical protein
MKVYLINKETNEVDREFDNVINWSYNFVEYNNNGRAKIYCDIETEYFTDNVEVIEDVE